MRRRAHGRPSVAISLPRDPAKAWEWHVVRVNQQVLIGCPVEEVATADNRPLKIEIERCAPAWISHLEAVVEGVPDAEQPLPALAQQESRVSWRVPRRRDGPDLGEDLDSRRGSCLSNAPPALPPSRGRGSMRPRDMLRRWFADGFPTGVIALAGAPNRWRTAPRTPRNAVTLSARRRPGLCRATVTPAARQSRAPPSRSRRSGLRIGRPPAGTSAPRCSASAR